MERNLTDYQNEYMNNSPFEPCLVEERRKLVLDQIAKFNAKNILEIGCGDAPLFRYFDDFDKYIVLEPGNLFFNNAIIHRKQHPYSERITVVCDFFQGKTDIIRDFDIIICSGLLHELQNQDEFVKKLYQVANPSTIVHINMPNVNSFHRLLAKKAGIINSIYDISDNQKRLQQNVFFSMSQLENLCVSSGFKVIGKGTFSFKPFTNSQMQQILDKNIISKDVLLALFKMEEYNRGHGSEMYVNLRK